MRDDNLVALHASHTRYEHLRRIVRRYELGELTDGEFKYLKRQLLHGQVPAEEDLASRIVLLLAGYSSLAALHASLEGVRSLPRTTRTRIIDAAITDRHADGFIQVRAIADISKMPDPQGISIAGAVCGLLFPADVLREGQHTRALNRSFGALNWNRVVQHELRAAGHEIAPRMSAILLLCWPAAADAVAAELHGYDTLKRTMLHDDVSDAIVAILADARVVH